MDNEPMGRATAVNVKKKRIIFVDPFGEAHVMRPMPIRQKKAKKNALPETIKVKRITNDKEGT